MQDQKYGTPVTAENFAKWLTKFKAELEAKKAKETVVKPVQGGEAQQLTGMFVRMLHICCLLELL